MPEAFCNRCPCVSLINDVNYTASIYWRLICIKLCTLYFILLFLVNGYKEPIRTLVSFLTEMMRNLNFRKVRDAMLSTGMESLLEVSPCDSAYSSVLRTQPSNHNAPWSEQGPPANSRLHGWPQERVNLIATLMLDSCLFGTGPHAGTGAPTPWSNSHIILFRNKQRTKDCWLPALSAPKMLFGWSPRQEALESSLWGWKNWNIELEVD